MLHLQAELQIRHDRRLDLAAKRRKHEDDHVTLMRKVEENSVWSWWKVCISVKLDAQMLINYVVRAR